MRPALPVDPTSRAKRVISGALSSLLVDLLTLYRKTQDSHHHVFEPHDRDYRLLMDEQKTQIFAMTDSMAKLVRKVLGTPVSIRRATRDQRVTDDGGALAAPIAMLNELCEDNRELAARMREAQRLCDELGDVVSASLLEVWIDETERRTRFLVENASHSDANAQRAGAELLKTCVET
jgi:starvation-inducible DNA-binding protein